ncbi:hypothetical protein ACQP1P_13370 [Dactylosporangium sp. CA-052675]|uniref:hypothetical protein n=1 Tax=Dactylosporangium sp. CA-052675 TaxID=3239927 RepID=UPI003D8DA5F8
MSAVRSLIEASAAKFPDKTAITGDDVTVTYAELWRRSSAFAVRRAIAVVVATGPVDDLILCSREEHRND